MQTIEELINNKSFIARVKKNVAELTTKRVNRKQPKAGFKYKRDWYDRMIGKVNAEYFLANILAIWEGKSSLNREERKIIKYVCDCALLDTLNETK